MFMRSERLFLRPAWPEDWEELHREINDERIARNLTELPWPFAGKDARELVAIAETAGLPRFLLTLPSIHGSQIVGGVGFARYGDDAAIDFWIGRRHRGRGYAQEALDAALQVAFGIGHRRIYALPFSEDAASARALRKAGFQPTGESRRRYSAGRGAFARSTEYARDLAGTVNAGAEKPAGNVRLAA